MPIRFTDEPTTKPGQKSSGIRFLGGEGEAASAEDVKRRLAGNPEGASEAELQTLFQDKERPTTVADVGTALKSGIGAGAEIIKTAAKGVGEAVASKIPGTESYDPTGARGTVTILDALGRGSYDVVNLLRMGGAKARDAILDNPKLALTAIPGVAALPLPKAPVEKRLERFKGRYRANEEAVDRREFYTEKVGSILPGFSSLPEEIQQAVKPLPNLSEAGSYVLDPTVPLSMGLSTLPKAAAKAGVKTLAGRIARGVEKVGAGVKYAGQTPERAVSAITKKLAGGELADQARKLTKAGEIGAIPFAIGGLGGPVTAAVATLKGAEATGATVEKVGQLAGKIVSAPADSQFSRLYQVSKNPDNPLWMRTMSRMLDKSGIGAAAGFAKDVSKSGAQGAAMGAGFGAASAESPEEFGAAVGSGATLGGASRVAVQPIVKRQRLIAGRMGDISRFVEKAVETGTNPEILARVGDEAILAAATLDKAFEGQVNFQFVDANTFVQRGGVPEASASWDNNTRTVMVNVNSAGRKPANGFFHEVGHALAASEVASKPEIKLLVDAALNGRDIEAVKRAYAEALLRGNDATKTLSPAEVEAVVQNESAKSQATYNDPNFWIYSEIYAEAALRGLKGKDIFSDILNYSPLKARAMDSAGRIFRALGVKTETDAPKPGSFFANFDDVLDNRELRGMIFRHIRERNDYITGKSKPTEGAVVVTKEMVGKHAGVPIHDLPDGTRGNDFVVEVAPGQIMVRSKSDVSKIERERAKEVEAATSKLPQGDDLAAVKVVPPPAEPVTGANVPPVLDTKGTTAETGAVPPPIPGTAEKPAGTPASPVIAADDGSVRWRKTISGLRQLTGSKLGDWFYGLKSFTQDTKNNARLVEGAIADGGSVRFWYQAASAGTGSDYAKNFKRLKGGVAISEREVLPFAFRVSKTGEVDIAGRKIKTGGNVLVVGLDMTSANRKAMKWQAENKLQAWNGDIGAFKSDLLTYVRNHAEGLPGEANGVGIEKKNDLNAFVVGDNRAFSEKNPRRDLLKGEDKNGIIRSFRIDRIETVTPTGEKIGPAEYNKKILNLSPDSTADDVIASARALREGKLPGMVTPQQFSPAREEGQLAGKPLPHAVGPGAIPIVHYTSRDIKTLDPKYFGKGRANNNDLRGAQKSYAFVEGSPLKGDEWIFKDQRAYGAKVDGSRIYDLTANADDVLGYFDEINREKADQKLRSKGYVGVMVDTADGRKVVMLYRPVKVEALGLGVKRGKAIPAKQFSPDAPVGEKTAALRKAVQDELKKLEAEGYTRDEFGPWIKNPAGEVVGAAGRMGVGERVFQADDPKVQPYVDAVKAALGHWQEKQDAKRPSKRLAYLNDKFEKTPGELTPAERDEMLNLRRQAAERDEVIGAAQKRREILQKRVDSLLAKAPENLQQWGKLDWAEQKNPRFRAWMQELTGLLPEDAVPDGYKLRYPSKMQQDSARFSRADEAQRFEDAGIGKVEPAYYPEDSTGRPGGSKVKAERVKYETAIKSGLDPVTLTPSALLGAKENSLPLVRGAAEKGRNLISALMGAKGKGTDAAGELASGNQGAPFAARSASDPDLADTARAASLILSLPAKEFEADVAKGLWPDEVVTAAREARAAVPAIENLSFEGAEYMGSGSEGRVYSHPAQPGYVYKVFDSLGDNAGFYLRGVQPVEAAVGLDMRVGNVFDILNRVDRQNKIEGFAPTEVLGITPDERLVVKMPLLEDEASSAEIRAWAEKHGGDLEVTTTTGPQEFMFARAVGEYQPIIQDKFGNYYALADARTGNFRKDAEGNVYLTDAVLVPITAEDVAAHPDLRPWAPKDPANIQWSPDVKDDSGHPVTLVGDAKVPSQAIRLVAQLYTQGRGLNKTPFVGYVPVKEDLAIKLADAYEAAKHRPNDPRVKRSYKSLIEETAAQWGAIVAAGYTLEPWKKEGQPYANSNEMRRDVLENKHLWYFPTEGGFGDTAGPKDHPLLKPVSVGGQTVLANDLFRAVHDFFGHAKEGYEFGPRGEYNAYLAHGRMYSDVAQAALASETLAQNSWVNYGRHVRGKTIKGKPGYIAPQDRPFAEQKATFLPPALVRKANAVHDELVRF